MGQEMKYGVEGEGKPFTEAEESKLRGLMSATYMGCEITIAENNFIRKMFDRNKNGYDRLHDEVTSLEDDELVNMIPHGSGIKTSCKIGTIPALVYVDGRCKIEVGNKIRVRETDHGSEWFNVIVDKINYDGYFFAYKV